MRLSHQTRVFAALLALFSVLFTQLAVAAYACPSMQIAQAMESIAAAAQATAHRDMPGCEGMDAEKSVLCQNHGQAGQQSLDKPGLPQVQPFMAAMLVQMVGYADGISLSLPLPAAGRILTRITAPPLAIRNCCFRI